MLWMAGTGTRLAQNLLLTSQQSSAGSLGAVRAFDDASTKVTGVANAATELSACIAEISRQLSHTMQIVGAATSETAATDSEIANLSASGEKIGEVVGLIRSIAAEGADDTAPERARRRRALRASRRVEEASE